jgi:hypothetical protein
MSDSNASIRGAPANPDSALVATPQSAHATPATDSAEVPQQSGQTADPHRQGHYFLSPEFMKLAKDAYEGFDGDFDLDDDSSRPTVADFRWVPYVLATIFNSSLPESKKHSCLVEFLELISEIILVKYSHGDYDDNCDDPTETEVTTAVDSASESSAASCDKDAEVKDFRRMLDDYYPLLAKKNGRYVYHPDCGTGDPLLDRMEALLNESVCLYLSQYASTVV